MEDFAVDLDLADDPIPVATFKLEDKEERRTIPGIIFAARVKNPDAAAAGSLKEKHSEIKWIPAEEIRAVRKEEFVPDFIENVERALAWLKQS